MKMNVQIDGLKELDAKLRRIADQFEDKAATGITKNALRKAARVVRDDAKRLVPVDQGNVRDNIVVVTENAKNRPSDAPGDGPSALVTVRKFAKSDGTPLYYARFLEFGTEKMSKKPFLRPAFDENKQSLPGIIRKSLADGIDKFVRKLPK